MLSRTSGRYKTFTTSLLRDTSRRKCTTVQFIKPECQTIFRMKGSQSRRSRPRDQNVPRNIGEASFAGYIQLKKTQRSSKDQVKWLHLRPRLVPSWCGTSRAGRGLWKTPGSFESENECMKPLDSYQHSDDKMWEGGKAPVLGVQRNLKNNLYGTLKQAQGGESFPRNLPLPGKCVG